MCALLRHIAEPGATGDEGNNGLPQSQLVRAEPDDGGYAAICFSGALGVGQLRVIISLGLDLGQGILPSAVQTVKKQNRKPNIF